MTSDPFRGTPYRPIRKLGAGGMGEVYEVEHEVVGRLMVAKVLRRELASDLGIADRMRFEAQALAALSDPNIVNVTDFARTADGRPFFVMERLDGCTLGEELRRRGAFPVTEAIEIVCQILSGLSAAHRIGLVHRDVKLDNVFLHRAASGQRVVKLLDFGVAKVFAGRGGAGPAPLSLPTTDGAIVGTPRYMSPEQVLAKGIDHRADLYATGLVLYILVCGRGPFDHVRTQDDFLIAHLGDDPPAPSDVARQAIPHELDAAILKALRKNPADRFQTAAEFSATLAAIVGRRGAPIGWLETTPSDAPVRSAMPLRTEVIDHPVPPPPPGALLPTRTAQPLHTTPGVAAPIAPVSGARVDNAARTSNALAYAGAAITAAAVAVVAERLIGLRSIGGLAAVLALSVASGVLAAKMFPAPGR